MTIVEHRGAAKRIPRMEVYLGSMYPRASRSPLSHQGVPSGCIHPGNIGPLGPDIFSSIHLGCTHPISLSSSTSLCSCRLQRYISALGSCSMIINQQVRPSTSSNFPKSQAQIITMAISNGSNGTNGHASSPFTNPRGRVGFDMSGITPAPVSVALPVHFTS